MLHVGLHHCSNAFRSGAEVPRCMLFPTSSIPGSEAAGSVPTVFETPCLCSVGFFYRPDKAVFALQLQNHLCATLHCLERRRILPISNCETDEAHVDLETEAEVVALCVGSFTRQTSPLSSPAPRCFAKDVELNLMCALQTQQAAQVLMCIVAVFTHSVELLM